MSEFDLLNGAALGMQQQRALLDISARNVAAAQASRPGHEYARLVADFSAAAAQTGDEDDGEPADAGADDADAADGESAIAGDAAAVPRVHAERGSADALTEMIAVLDAQRSYEQNASIFDLGKHLAERTLEIGRS